MSNIIEQNKEWINSTFDKISNKLQKVAVRSRNKLPYTVDENGVHDNKAENQIFWWTNGFWGGMMWLMYSHTKNEDYLKTARISGEMVNKIFADFKHIDHDAGFLWHLTAGADYRLTGSKEAWNANMLAASCLYSRYKSDAKYIIAWNGPSNRSLTIIDCLMNLPLLYWASDQIKDNRFCLAAQNHADMSLRDHIRKDGSIYHQVVHDVETGEFIEAKAGQGYSTDSCWTRGLAWAVYGMLISYIHTGERRYLDASIKCADYFIENVKNYIEESLCADISVTEIARIFNYNEKYIGKLFKESQGEGIIDYVNRKRLVKAKELLELSTQTVTEIAQQTGFNNVTYFNRLFKKRFGETPTEYRKEKYKE